MGMKNIDKLTNTHTHPTRWSHCGFWFVFFSGLRCFPVCFVFRSPRIPWKLCHLSRMEKKQQPPSREFHLSTKAAVWLRKRSSRKRNLGVLCAVSLFSASPFCISPWAPMKQCMHVDTVFSCVVDRFPQIFHCLLFTAFESIKTQPGRAKEKSATRWKTQKSRQMLKIVHNGVRFRASYIIAFNMLWHWPWCFG